MVAVAAQYHKPSGIFYGGGAQGSGARWENLVFVCGTPSTNSGTSLPGGSDGSSQLSNIGKHWNVI